MEDTSSTVTAGVLCFLLTSFICCREEAAPPAVPARAVEQVEPAAGRRALKKRARRVVPVPYVRPEREGDNRGGGSGSSTSSGGGGRALVEAPPASWGGAVARQGVLK